MEWLDGSLLMLVHTSGEKVGRRVEACIPIYMLLFLGGVVFSIACSLKITRLTLLCVSWLYDMVVLITCC